MGLILGTNCGFVETAPVDDPSGSAATIDTWYWATKHTTPVGAAAITEVGWWCNNATEETNFEVGLYSHNAGTDKPDARLFVSATNAKGTDAGWKTATVNWAVSAETIYWIAVQVDDTAVATTCDWQTIDNSRSSIKSAQTTLTDPWSATSSQGAYAQAIYAVWSAGGTPVDISGTIAGTSSLSGVLTAFDTTALTGTIAATSTLSGSLTLSPNWQTENMATIKRLVAIGNDSFFYEDI